MPIILEFYGEKVKEICTLYPFSYALVKLM